MVIAQAAELKYSTPAEGFDNALVDETLDLASLGLKSVTLLYLGYRCRERLVIDIKSVIRKRIL
jgi:hypothetical protein